MRTAGSISAAVLCLMFLLPPARAVEAVAPPVHDEWQGTISFSYAATEKLADGEAAYNWSGTWTLEPGSRVHHTNLETALINVRLQGTTVKEYYSDCPAPQPPAVTTYRTEESTVTQTLADIRTEGGRMVVLGYSQAPGGSPVQLTETVESVSCDGTKTSEDVTPVALGVPQLRIDVPFAPGQRSLQGSSAGQDPAKTYLNLLGRAKPPPVPVFTWDLQLTRGDLKASFTWSRTSDRIEDFGRIDFDAGASTDPRAGIRRYEWDWDDGSSDAVSSPQIAQTYPRDDDYHVTMRFVDENGDVSKPASATVPVCDRTPVPVTLPEVNVSYHDLAKVLRLRYGALPLRFLSVPPASDATCSFSGTGILPVTIGLGPAVFDIPISIQSHATARLDFLRGGASAPPCRWAIPNRGDAVARNCVIGGAGDVLVRWHTDGFSERIAGGEVYNSGPLTYYARASSSQTYAEAIVDVEERLHTELSLHLGWIKPFYMIQEPPADLGVLDAAGRVTGVERPGALARQEIPASAYAADAAGHSAVALLDPQERQYTIRVTGEPGSPYLVSVALIRPVADAVISEARFAGAVDADGSVTLACNEYACVQCRVSP